MCDGGVCAGGGAGIRPGSAASGFPAAARSSLDRSEREQGCEFLIRQRELGHNGFRTHGLRVTEMPVVTVSIGMTIAFIGTAD